mmetsp:Transcript_12878/g.32094  ORF Transcript_12878/g.32094 Transcript_12878/m.32094 type:complete len:221 (-) Transcript_12878:102-764(-)
MHRQPALPGGGARALPVEQRVHRLAHRAEPQPGAPPRLRGAVHQQPLTLELHRPRPHVQRRQALHGDGRQALRGVLGRVPRAAGGGGGQRAEEVGRLGLHREDGRDEPVVCEADERDGPDGHARLPAARESAQGGARGARRGHGLARQRGRRGRQLRGEQGQRRDEAQVRAARRQERRVQGAGGRRRHGREAADHLPGGQRELSRQLGSRFFFFGASRRL